MNELKNCPFCGGKAEKIGIKIYGVDRYIIECTEPSCRMRTAYLFDAISAIETWNKRNPYNELKPCPLCGGFPVIKQGLPYDNRRNPYYVECLDCHSHTVEDHKIQNVIKIWNRRVNE